VAPNGGGGGGGFAGTEEVGPFPLDVDGTDATIVGVTGPPFATVVLLSGRSPRRPSSDEPLLHAASTRRPASATATTRGARLITVGLGDEVVTPHSRSTGGH
jgi:hypothetical protein